MSVSEHIHIRYSDGYEAFARLWLPTSPRGSVLYLHGIQSHGLWFEMSAQRMADAGFVVLLPDRRGSGRNERDRGHTPSAARLVRDVIECGHELHARTGMDRTHVGGVSWGGKLALAYADAHPEAVASVTLIAPGLFPKVDIPASQKVRVGISALMGGHALFDIPLQDPELFTENPERQDFIRTDPLALRKVTSRFLVASRRLDTLAQRIRRRQSGPPVCLFLAGLDRIIKNEATRQFVEHLGWPQTQIREYGAAHHTLEFEADPRQFFDDLVAWLSGCH